MSELIPAAARAGATPYGLRAELPPKAKQKWQLHTDMVNAQERLALRSVLIVGNGDE